jgi:predicted hydrocarbon binding protein
VKTGLEAMAALMARLGDERVTISENERFWYWRSEHCPYCWQRTLREPVCYFTTGMLQEFFTWASSGRVYTVVELECRAAGAAACLFQIDKKALD